MKLYDDHDHYWREQNPELYHIKYSILNHCTRVGMVAEAVARKLSLSEVEVTKIAIAALAHDISKVDKSCVEYRETRSWSEAERKAYDEKHQHLSQKKIREIGLEMLRPQDQHFINTVSIIAGSHHHWHRVRIPDLRQKCLIVSLSDSFVAMQEDRKYKLGLSQFQAIDKLRLDVENFKERPEYKPYAPELDKCLSALVELYGSHTVLPS